MASTSSPTLPLNKLEFPFPNSRRSNKITSYIPFVRTHFSDFTISHKISKNSGFHSTGSAVHSRLNDYSVEEPTKDQSLSTQETTKNQPELEVQTRMWNWRGYKIRYQCCGSSGPALVLVHGFGANSDHWRKNIPVLANSHRVYSIDLIGYGYSDKPNPREFGINTFYTFETWATQLNEFCIDVVKDQAFFICNSIGGLVGLQAAVLEPQICKGIVLLNISLRMLHIKKQPGYGRPLIRSFQSLLRDTALGKFFSRLLPHRSL
ncbi:hypothetical protein L1049_019024 [Liquidambar formosana]|uniref:AB hydrolase-1 domain-containing protein n=1 Tax=Liquidambar formosana TaxID=63359 RepID=A0AAP0WPJ3_LIQFO